MVKPSVFQNPLARRVSLLGANHGKSGAFFGCFSEEIGFMVPAAREAGRRVPRSGSRQEETWRGGEMVPISESR